MGQITSPKWVLILVLYLCSIAFPGRSHEEDPHRNNTNSSTPSIEKKAADRPAKNAIKAVESSDIFNPEPLSTPSSPSVATIQNLPLLGETVLAGVILTPIVLFLLKGRARS